jgi:hypothetical protein
MKKISLKVLTLMAVLTSAGLVAATASDNETLNQIAGYRQWTRINQQPVLVVLDPGSFAI